MAGPDGAAAAGMPEVADVVVIGGGIAGASAAAEIAGAASVVLLEAEAACGMHATGRSAASFTETYGPAVVRALARAGRRFLESPPDGFTAVPLMRPRGLMTIAREDQRDALAAMAERAQAEGTHLEALDAAGAMARVPILREGYAFAALLEPASREIDVDALHQGWLRQARRRGALIVTSAPVEAITGEGAAGWRIVTPRGVVRAGVIVNAAGAWADRVAAMAGVAPLGLAPLRRTAFLIDPPEGVRAAGWPLVDDVGGRFYFKTDAGRIFVSPADATPSPPMDVWPDEMDIAEGAARFEAATRVEVRRIARSWAGLRTFAPDGDPVAGFATGGKDDAGGGFFWLAGQGGYGIKTAPALSRATAALVLGREWPEELAAAGVTPARLSPARLAAT
jgi:D-arginine dehydrogenase